MWKVCLLTCQGYWCKLSAPDFWGLSLQGRRQGGFSNVATRGGEKKKPDRITSSNMMGVNKTTQSLWWACWGESKGLIWEQRMAYLKIQLRIVSRMLFYKMCILWLWALDLSLHFLIQSVGCIHTDTTMPFLFFTIIFYSFHYFFGYFL